MFTPITNLYEKFIVSQLLSYKPNSVKFKQHHEQKQEGNEIRYKDVMAVDKTCNFYILEQEIYDEQLRSNITKNYKKAKEESIEDLNEEDRAIVEKLKIDDRL